MALGIVPALCIHLYYTNTYEKGLIKSRIDSLKKVSIITRNAIITSDYLNTHSSDTVETELAMISSVFDGRTMVIDDSFRILKDTYYVDNDKICVSENVIKCFLGQNTIKYSEEQSYIEIAVALSDSTEKLESGSIDGVLLMSYSLDDIKEHARNAEEEGQIMLMIIWSVVGGMAFSIQYLICRPFTDMAESIEEIKLGQLDRDFQWDAYTEVEELGQSVKHMMDRMKKMDESRQEFVSNVSHELKTPITSIKVLSDAILAEENVPNEMYREFMTDIVAEMDRESGIINDLLTLVKLEKKTETMNVKKIDINMMVESALKRLKPIAEKKNIELVYESFKTVEAEIDEVKMGMAVNNLVENAIKYNVNDGWVRVSLNADYKFFYLKVSDSGIGIPKEAQEKIFERFYRVDKARSRESGGTGLGLSITYNIVIAHKGDIKVYSEVGEGSTFTVRIPLVYVP